MCFSAPIFLFVKVGFEPMSAMTAKSYMPAEKDNFFIQIKSCQIPDIIITTITKSIHQETYQTVIWKDLKVNFKKICTNLNLIQF